MQKEIFSLQEYAQVSRLFELNNYNNKLYNITKFPLKNIYQQSTFFRIVLNFSFKNINFNKKRALPFFLAMELLTNQKCIATLSSKNILAWKLRKGALVGCKVTLRNKNLYTFLDNLLLALPRMEKFTELNISKERKQKNNSFIIKLSEILLFYPIELGLGINTEVKQLEINFIMNTTTIEEKKFLFSTFKLPTQI